MRARFVVVLAALGCDAAGRSAPPLTGRDVAAALAEVRPYAVRLSGSVRFVPCLAGNPADSAFSWRCSAAGTNPAQLARAATLARRIRDAPGAARSAGDLWAASLLDLSDPATAESRIDAVVARLEEARGAEEPPAALLNDLAVAYLVRGSTQHAAGDLYQALELLELASADSAAPDVVRFNRAALLDRLGLVALAAGAWKEYIGGTERGEWVEEARRRIAALEAGNPAAGRPGEVWPPHTPEGVAELAGLDPQAARELVLGTLLPRWAGVAGSPPIASESLIAAADTAGATLARVAGDSSVALAVAEARRMHAGRAAGLRAALDAAVRGDSAYQRGDYAAAAPLLARAATALRRGGAPSLAAWSEAILGGIDMHLGRYQRAEALLQRIVGEATRRQAWALAGRSHWILALSRSRREDLGGAEREYDAANEAFARAGERGNRGRVLTQLGQVRTRLGRDDAGLDAVLLGVQLLRVHGTLRARHDALVALGQQLQEAQLPGAALAAFREALATAPRTGRPADHVEAMLYYASAQARSRTGGDAQATFARARSLAAGLADAPMRERLLADIDRTEGWLMAARDPSGALPLLDRAAAYFSALGNRFVRNETIMLRARVNLQRQDTASAEADLDALAAALSSPSPSAGTEDDRRRQIEIRRELFEVLFHLALARGDTAGALGTYAMLVGSGPDDAARFLREPVAPGVTVAAYAVLPGEVTVWIKRGDSIRVRHQRAARENVAELVARFERVVAQSSAGAAGPGPGEALARLLLDPVLEVTPPGDEVALVVDGELRRVPFAALPVKDGLLIEQHPLRYTARLSTASRPERGVGAASRLRALVVGRPEHDRDLFPVLADLRHAAEEAGAVAGLYRAAKLAGDSVPTRKWLASQLPEAQVFHFAGHARLAPARAEQSHLVLARDGPAVEDNALFAWEIARLDLHRLELAVLSSCGTATRTSRRVATSQGLAQAFLDAGAREVVSSQWEADDEATAGLMATLHRELVAGAPTSQALRTAQLEGLRLERASRGSSQWASFRLDER